MMEDRDYGDIIYEDCIVCWFFSNTHKSNSEWEDLCSYINNGINKNTQSYIWHKDIFHVFKPLTKNTQDIPPHLFSSTNYGDNVKDEWYIVYLIRKLSLKNSELVIHVKDNDGDFLLIEAADYLPDWASPDTTHNRVFIYNGNLHIIPPNIVSVDKELKIGDAVNLIIQHPEETRASLEIQNTAFKRIEGYPQKVPNNFHHAIANIPVELAALLALDPSIISPIVDAYCHHDVFDAKCCTKVDNQNWVLSKVKFTKFQYSMLLSSKLLRSGTCAISEKSDKRDILGYKLVCGYLMVINKLSGDIFTSKDYIKFINSLKLKGYFKDNLEGSQEYCRLLETANDYYISMECPSSKMVNDSITKLKSSKEFIDMRDKIIKGTVIVGEDDNDDWLNIDPEQLTDLLNTRYSSSNKNKITPETLTDNINSFLNQKSDYEGIEIDNKNQNNNIDFQPDLFAESLKKILNFVSPENDRCETMEDFDFTEDDSSDEHSDTMDLEANEVDKEIKESLSSDIINTNNKHVSYTNLIKSMKEEEGSRGPSSNLLSSVGFRKTDILDSDDDSE